MVTAWNGSRTCIQKGYHRRPQAARARYIKARETLKGKGVWTDNREGENAQEDTSVDQSQFSQAFLREIEFQIQAVEGSRAGVNYH